MIRLQPLQRQCELFVAVSRISSSSFAGGAKFGGEEDIGASASLGEPFPDENFRVAIDVGSV